MKKYILFTLTIFLLSYLQAHSNGRDSFFKIESEISSEPYLFLPNVNTIIYANHAATGANDGTSWVDAFTSLHDALNEAEAIGSCQIRVAKGTGVDYVPLYTPTGDIIPNRERTYHIDFEVEIYGGYLGTGPNPDERDFVLHETVLSGDRGVVGDMIDNVYHVITFENVSSATILDGFTIEKGNAVTGVNGGGIYNLNSDVTISNCRIQNNEAVYGAGMYNDTGNPTIGYCTFENNNSNNDSYSQYGGGIYNVAGSPIISNSTFSNNWTFTRGGGIYSAAGSPIISKCIFNENHSSTGGGIRISGGTIDIINCLFWGNDAGNGGALYSRNGTTTIINSTLHDNNAGVGGGIYQHNNGQITVTNCIAWGNIAPLNLPYNPNVTVIGTDPNTALITNCIMDYNCTPAMTCTDIINADPQFVDVSSDNYRLKPCSPAIDAGTSSGAPIVDLDCITRPVNINYDIGAYEFPGTPNFILYVNHSTMGANNGLSWVDAFTNLQDALNEAKALCSAEIWVAQGTGQDYVPSKLPSGATTPAPQRTFYIDFEVEIYGGFNGTEIYRNERNPDQNETVLSGERGVVGDMIDNVYHVITFENVSSSSIIDGFTIERGNAVTGVNGAGIYNLNSDVTISNCKIQNNEAVNGAGIYNDTGNPTIEHCTFENNNSNNNSYSQFGGGIYNVEGSPIISNSTFSNNWTFTRGGGIYSAAGSPTISKCVFNENHSSTGGGLRFDGIIGESYSCVITNCLFWGNDAGDGGGLYSRNGTTTVINSTFHDNSASVGGGIFQHFNGEITVTNCIAWGNTAPLNIPYNPNIAVLGSDPNTALITNCIMDYNCTLAMTCSDIINADPQFVDESNHEYQLVACSPAIDAGTSSGAPADDLGGDARPFGIEHDLGAFEFQNTPEPTITYYPDTDGDTYGDPNGTPEIVCQSDLQPAGFVIDNTDCDDTNFDINPATTESCDGVDNNCDGTIDEGFDLDSDGYTSCDGDCNDSDPTVNPGATEVCDGIDNNCDDIIDGGMIVLQPDGNDGKDAFVMGEISRQSNNYETSEVFYAMASTWEGSPGAVREYFDFNIPTLPSGAIVTTAILDLYAAPWVNDLCLSGTNETKLEAVSDPWDEGTLTWINQPGAIGIPELYPAHCSSTDLSMDVTNLIEAFSPNGNGVVWSLQNEAYYRAMSFYSSDATDPTKRPKLTINWSHDSDGDDICNIVDNCPNDANALQEDLDQDGIGDACDSSMDIGTVVDNTIVIIEDLNLDNGQAFESNLQDALDKYCEGKVNQAINKLNAFINQVNGQSGGNLTVAEADELISIAEAMIEAMENGEIDCDDNSGMRLSGSSEDDGLQLAVAPNPFYLSTLINFTLKEDKKVSLIIYDITGKRVKVLVNELLANGDHQIEWNAQDESGKVVPGGIYYFRFQAGSHIETRSIVRVH